jgi:hypothetical protein
VKPTESAAVLAVIGIFIVLAGCIAVGLAVPYVQRLVQARYGEPTPTPEAVVRATRLAPGELTVLRPGEAMVVDEVELRVRNQTLDPICDGVLGFDLSFYDPDFWSLSSFYGADLVVSDDTGQTYQAFFDLYPGLSDCDSWSRLGDLVIDLGQNYLGGTDRADVAIYAAGQVPPEATTFYITVYRAGPIEDVVWEVSR